jgi:DNA-directed RNA polymerase subunit RPC12/RpoP
MVSRHHAIIRCHDGVVTIEDNGSTNGTFVNGRRVTTAQISANDTVWLGGNGGSNKCYKLDMNRLFAKFPPVTSKPKPKSNPDDYTREFAQVKKAYIDYHAQLSKLNRKTNIRIQLPRVLLTAIPAVLSLVLMLIYGFGIAGFIAMTAGSVLGNLIGTLTMGKSSKRQDKLSEDIMDLQLRYKKLYKCPKCGKEFGLDLHWKKIQADGQCPHGCGARFV